MIASLMMYDRPELQGPHDRYWALIRSELAARGLSSPERLSNEADPFTVWCDPALVLSQTCGMPYRLWLHEDIALVGTPDYGLSECPPGHYRSPIVVRSKDPRATLKDYADARFAFNADHSQSGFAAIYNTVASLGFWFKDRVVSGSHLSSARMVAQGDADIAALDAVTWALIQRYDAFSENLRVLSWTTPTPGLPYIAAKTADAPATFDAVQAAIAALAEADRAALMLNGIVRIDTAAYLEVPNPPEAASSS